MAGELTLSKNLIALANSPEVERTRDFPATAASLDADQVAAMYEALRDTAPHHHARDKTYFVGHTGVPSTKGASNRVEEHLAIALCNTRASFPLGDSDRLGLLDYQVPLKARQADKGIGKIDILGVTASGRIAVAELKVTTDTSNGDNPLRALLESLAYCAIVEASVSDISTEIGNTFFTDTEAVRPNLVVIGPDHYWSTWTSPALASVYELSDRLDRTFDMQIWFLNLGDVDVVPGSGGTKPHLVGRFRPPCSTSRIPVNCTWPSSPENAEVLTQVAQCGTFVWMTNAEPARHALYAELERVLGVEHADTLMTHLPQHTADNVSTKGDIELLANRFDRMDDRFDRMDDRFDRMEDRMDKMQRNFLTVSFGTLTVMTAVFALITRI